jgi:hypothetical protein
MRGKHTIVINGRHYDAITGLPAETPSESAQVSHAPANHAPVKITEEPKKEQPAQIAVSRPQAHHLQHAPLKSKTLRRDIVKRPAGAHDKAAKHVTQHAHVAKSPLVTKFAPHPVGVVTAGPVKATQAVQPSSVVTAAHHKSAARHHKPDALSSRELKEHLIKQQIDHAPAKANHKPHKTKKAPLRVSSVMAACLGIMILGGYLSYINMPNLSVRVAAAQAGIDAEYPGYTPSGYRFDGPVSYSNGQVLLSFKATGGTTNYQINQQRSAWDSQAVLDNYVVAQSEEYDVNDTQGLTVYTYGNQAAWVNKGVLYTISGDAPLRTEQVLKIATSL